MTAGLQFTMSSTLQPYIWQKGKEKKKSARYFPMRNFKRDKNISEITGKLHPAGVCFYLA